MFSDMNPEILSLYLLGAELARDGGWHEKLPWLDPVDVDAEAGEAVVRAMELSDGGKPTMAFLVNRVEWRLLDLSRRRVAKRVRSLSARDELELGGPADEVLGEVGDRDEREVLSAWLARQGRDGVIVGRRLEGMTVEEIAEELDLSERHVRRVLTEILAAARGRFR